MLAIRPEQISAFRQSLWSELPALVTRHLREHHELAVAGIGSADLLALVQQGIARAARHGLVSESSTTLFVALMFEIAPNFDRHPRVAEILAKRSVDPDARMAALVDALPPATWAEAKAAYDERAWLGHDDDELKERSS